MRTRIVVAVAALLLAAGILPLFFPPKSPIVPRGSVQNSADARIGGPGKTAPLAKRTAADDDRPTVQYNRDPAAVFQRAFWRRPGAGDRIRHAERRDWVDASAAVQKWQWFVVVDPSPEFRRWLIEDNPFELVPAAGSPPDPENPPGWFPPTETLAGLTQYRNRGGRLTVFLDPKSGRLFATDAGSGFAAAAR